MHRTKGNRCKDKDKEKKKTHQGVPWEPLRVENGCKEAAKGYEYNDSDAI
jgi:hypothetical protein